MRRFVFTMTALIFFMSGQAWAADHQVEGVLKIKSDISNIMKGIERTISRAAKETGNPDLQCETEIRKLLQSCNAGRSYVIDSAFIDNRGIMKFIEPRQYRKHEGSNISGQEAVANMMKTKKPWMGNAFVSVEGIKSIDIEYPVFSKDKHFLGSISMLIKHDDLIRSAAGKTEKERGVNCMVMQKDGLILYKTDRTQIGHNTFTDPLYQNFPEVIALGKRMIKEKEGEGYYSFTIPGTNRVVRKRTVWRTVRFFNKDWIIAAYQEVQ